MALVVLLALAWIVPALGFVSLLPSTGMSGPDIFCYLENALDGF